MISTFLQKAVSAVPWQVRGMIKHIPLVAPLQRWLISNFLTGEEFIHTVDAGPARGFRCPIVLPQDKGIWVGTYEAKLANLIAARVPAGSICFDVGAWRGFFSGVMALAGASRVYTFEPLPWNCEYLRRVIALNPELPIELVCAAVSDRAGVANFAVMPSSGMGKLTSSTFQKDVEPVEHLSVATITLDGWITANKSPSPALVKIDVEGAELSILRGASELLRMKRPELFIEAHSRLLARECAEAVQRHGYDYHVVETGRRLDGVSEPEVCHLVCLPIVQG
jgi:FkbM family methyltransferase